MIVNALQPASPSKRDNRVVTTIVTAFALMLALGLAACSSSTSTNSGASESETSQATSGSQSQADETTVITAESSGKEDVEAALNLANVKPSWTHSEDAAAWTMVPVTAVTMQSSRTTREFRPAFPART